MAIHTDEMKKKICQNILITKNTFVRVPFAFFLNGILSFWNFDGTVQQRELINQSSYSRTARSPVFCTP